MLLVGSEAATSPVAALNDRRLPPVGDPPAASAGTPLFPARPALAGNSAPLPRLPGRAATTAAELLPVGGYGIPATVLDAYRRAAATVDRQQSGCDLSWALLGGIGKVESNHAENGDVAPDGHLITPLYGPALNGMNGTAAISAGNGQWARAMGPMQFIPSSWARWAADGNGDGIADPQNVYDASLAAARYLCVSGGNLATPAAMAAAVMSYNHSQQYVGTVLSWYEVYQGGVLSLPDQPGGSASLVDFGSAAGTGSPTTAPVIGPPLAATVPAPNPVAGPPNPPSAGNGPPKPPAPAAPPAPPKPGPLAPVGPVVRLLPAPVRQLLAPILQPLTGKGLLGSP
jgi:hypothetical protein